MLQHAPASLTPTIDLITLPGNKTWERWRVYWKIKVEKPGMIFII